MTLPLPLPKPIKLLSFSRSLHLPFNVTVISHLSSLFHLYSLSIYHIICKRGAKAFVTNVRGLFSHVQVKGIDSEVSVLAFTVG
jgi:hypothetical protein